MAIKSNETTQRPVVKSTYKRSYYEKRTNKFKILYTTEIGMTLKKIVINIVLKNIAYKYFLSLLTFITIHFENRKLKLNSRAIKALEKVLQNHQKRSKDFSKNSQRIEPPSPLMKRHMKLMKAYLKLSKGDPNLKVMRKKHGAL